MEPPPDAALEEENPDRVQTFPNWLLRGIAQSGLSPERLLDMLGLDKTAGISDILAAISGKSLDSNAAVGYLAALYLGSVIAGGSASKAVDLKEALEGLRQLLEKVSQGYSPDEAVDLLTNGMFSSFADLEAQFTGGAAPGMEDFLTGMLLYGGDAAAFLESASMLTLLAGLEGMNLELMMGLLAAVQASGAGPEALWKTPPEKRRARRPRRTEPRFKPPSWTWGI